MPAFVVKSDGSKVPFELKKIQSSVMAACNDASITERAGMIAQEVSLFVLTRLEGKEEVPTSEIKALILEKLDASYATVARAWRDYESSKQ